MNLSSFYCHYDLCYQVSTYHRLCWLLLYWKLIDYAENSYIMLAIIILSTYHRFLFFPVTCKQIARYSGSNQLTLLRLAAAIS